MKLRKIAMDEKKTWLPQRFSIDGKPHVLNTKEEVDNFFHKLTGETVEWRHGRPVITATMAKCIDCPWPPYGEE